MTIFSILPFPEDIGQDTINQIDLEGRIIDFFAEPVEAEIEIGLNKRATGYKDDFQLSGDPLTISSEADGTWTILVPDSFNMTPDTYYRISINDVVFRKSLPDFPPRNYLNQLEDF